MQAPKSEGTNTGTRRVRRRAQLSCTECRRRKQKCAPREEGACTNCVRRYPPVECIFLPDPKISRKSDDGGGAVIASAFLPHRQVTFGINHNYPTVGSQNRTSAHSRLELEVASTLSSSLPESIVSHDGNSCLVFGETKDNVLLDRPEAQVAHLETSSTSRPVAFAGALTQINGMHGAYVKNSMRNAELWNFFHCFVIPNMCSVDGSSTSPLFVREMLPWMIQSPLMPHIAILMSSASQAAEPTLQTSRHAETIVIKSQVLSLINEFLRQDFSLVAREALRAVIHLVVIEWWWGTTPSLWAHMKGIRQMIKLRGGFQAINDPVLQQVFLVTDFEIACCFERDMFLLDPIMANGMEIPVPPTYSAALRSPLLLYPETFANDRMVLGISTETADILDDVRFLTLSITSDPGDARKIQNTAAWLHKKTSTTKRALPAENKSPMNIISATVRVIALVYTSSISNIKPFSTAWTPPLLEEFFTLLLSLNMSEWRKIPGIFLWIMLVACPGTEEDDRGKWMRKKMAVAGMQVGMEDFGVSISSLRAFWRVQRWIEREALRGGIDGEVDAGSGKALVADT